MQNRYILTAFGKDRPGIVADVSRVLYENGCNLEDTTMSMLDDEFTINLLFSSAGTAVGKALLAECSRLERELGITSVIRPIRERSAPGAQSTANATIHVEGLDQAGIVYKVSRFLAARGVNIVDLKSTVKTTPESGTALYLMDIHISIPATTGAGPIEAGLDEVAGELNVEISLSV